MECYKRPAFPERPAMLQLDDHELLDAYHAYQAGVKLTADKRRALSYFAAWRTAVWDIEVRAGMGLVSLADAALIFERQNLGDEADLLFSFAEEEHPGFRRAECLRGVAWWQLRDWCMVKGRNLSLLPGYMRTMRRPKGGVPFHKPQGQRDETSFGQGDLPWDGDSGGD